MGLPSDTVGSRNARSMDFDPIFFPFQKNEMDLKSGREAIEGRSGSRIAIP
jgi:hypothetical protein